MRILSATHKDLTAEVAAGRSLAERYADLDAAEKRLLDEVMEGADGNLSEAARRLGITRSVLRSRQKRLASGESDEEG